MRIIITVQPAYGHFHPLASLARELVKCNHELCFVTSKSFTPKIIAAGFKCQPLGLDWEESKACETFKELSGIVDRNEINLFWMKHIFAGETAKYMIPDLLKFSRKWQPDLIIHDPYEFAGALISEYLSIPRIKSGPMVLLPSSKLCKMVSDSISEHRKNLGLPADEDLSFYYDCTELAFIPRFLISKDICLSRNVYFLRPQICDEAVYENSSKLFDKIDIRKKIIYATLGTVFHCFPEKWSAIFDAVRYNSRYSIISSIPDRQIIDLFKHYSNNIFVTDYISQSLVYKYCDLVINHGGLNTIISAVLHGIPSIIMPIGADNFYNARQCESEGIARIVYFDKKPVENLKIAIEDIMSNKIYCEKISLLRKKIKQMPEVTKGIEIIEKL